MRRIGVIYNPLSDTSVTKSKELVAWLCDTENDAWMHSSQECRDNPEVLDNVELLVAMGGDGTVLRAARIAFPADIPVLAVALGHLSFMSEVEPTELRESVTQVLDGDCWHDKRTLVSVTLHRRGRVVAEYTGLNEVVISRSDVSRVVNAEVKIDNLPLTTYHADGVLVATATGSTAYALAAGGPIMDPLSRALVLVPIAAHLTNVPSMVLHEDAVVTLVLRSRHHASLAIDGRENIPLMADDEIEIKRSDKMCTFVRVKPSTQFYSQLVRRLHRS